MKRLAAAAGLLLLSLGGYGCTKRGGRVTYPSSPVVLISIDTLRSDRLPTYGYKNGATPSIDAFRKDAILYERAYTHVPLTLPAHATLFTGRLPAEHGVHDNLGYVLAKGTETLAERLKKSGYRTGGAISAVVLSHLSGISRGFDSWDDAVEVTEARQILSHVQRAGGQTASALERWMESPEAQGGPLFAFLHLYEPHAPYEPPEPWKSRFADPYDGEIAASDAILGDFLEFLRRKGLYDQSLVILVSDHGEGLLDHGEGEHGIFLYREALQIPLLVKLPGSAHAGQSVSSPVGLFDIFPTVLSVLGATHSESPPLPGRPLPTPGEPEPPVRHLFAETFYPRIHLGWSDLVSITDGKSHYIHAPRPEFYDMEKDPAEKTDLSSGKPEAFRAFRAEIEKMPRAFETPRHIDPDQATKLASLGYLTGGNDSEKGLLPDPKDGLPALARLTNGFVALNAGKNGEAAKVFRSLLDTNPRMQDVWDAYSRALLGLGRFDESVEALKTGARLSPATASSFYISIASLCLILHRTEEAEKHAQIALDRGNPDAYAMLARAALARGDLATAESRAKQALEALPRSRSPHLVLARVEIARRDLRGALAQLETADRKTSELKLQPLASVHYLKGEVLGGMNRPQEAEREFKAELELFPNNADAQASLALLYAAWGRKSEARQLVRKLTAGNPDTAVLAVAAQILGLLGDTAGAEGLRRRASARSGS